MGLAEGAAVGFVEATALAGGALGPEGATCVVLVGVAFGLLVDSALALFAIDAALVAAAADVWSTLAAITPVSPSVATAATASRITLLFRCRGVCVCVSISIPPRGDSLMGGLC